MQQLDDKKKLEEENEELGEELQTFSEELIIKRYRIEELEAMISKLFETSP